MSSPSARTRSNRQSLSIARAQEIDLLIAVCIDRQIDKPTLYLGPLVPRLSGKTVRVLLERLMKNADDQQPPAATRGHLGKLLEQMDVGPIPGGTLQKLAELVDEHRKATAGARMAHRDFFERTEDCLFGPGRRRTFTL